MWERTVNIPPNFLAHNSVALVKTMAYDIVYCVQQSSHYSGTLLLQFYKVFIKEIKIVKIRGGNVK
jgi:hypothetical protein